MLVVYWSGRVPEMEFPIQTHFVVKGLIAALAVSVLIWSRSRAAGVVLLAMVVLEASTLTAHRVTDLRNAVVAQSLLKYKTLAANLPPTGQGRIVADYNYLLTDLGDLYGVDMLQSFVSAVPENVLRLDFGNARTQQLLGVTDRIEKGQIRPVARRHAACLDRSPGDRSGAARARGVPGSRISHVRTTGQRQRVS